MLTLKTMLVKTFLHPYISYMANERLQGEEQFHAKNYFLEMPLSQKGLKGAAQKTRFVMAKAYTLDCSYTLPHSYA